MKNNTKVLVIGLDSATWRLMHPWMQEGCLPEISNLVDNGASGVLSSIVPPLTGPAWTSFLTGKSPGRHGVFSFMKRRPGTYEMMPVSTLDIEGETLADILSRHGKRVALINVPMTYPPRPTNGIIVTGLDTPSRDSPFTFPAELQSELIERFDYEIEYNDPVREGHEQAFLEQVIRIEEKRFEAVRELLTRGNWDLFSIVFRGTDILSHYFWRAQDRSHPGYDEEFAAEFGNVLRNHYMRMDEVVGELREIAGDECTVIIMSDHGSGPIKRKVYLDNWLLQQGLMKIRESYAAKARYWLAERGLTISNVLGFLMKMGFWGRIRGLVGRETRLKMANRFFGSMAIDWSNTKAYPVGIVGAININLEGREPSGIVTPGAEFDRIKQRIKQALLKLSDPDTGESLVSEVLCKEEVYEGPFAEDAPDLIIKWQDYAYKSTFMLGSSTEVMSAPLKGSYSGFHTMDGILAMRGPSIVRGQVLSDTSIIDVAPTILALLGLPIPEDMDGKVLQVFDRDLKLRYESDKHRRKLVEHASISTEDEKMVEERLKNLGYL